MNAKRTYVMSTVVILTALLLTGCLGGQPAEIDWEAVNAAQTATAQAGQPTLTIDQRVQATVQAMGGQPAASEPTPMPAAPADSGSDYQGIEGCVDGSGVDTQYADINRIPIGTNEGATVWELTWTGSSFGGFERAVVIIPRLYNNKMAFVRNARTVNGLQYCGFLKDIVSYAPTHVDALVVSAQNDAGEHPDPNTIGVYLINLETGDVQTVRESTAYDAEYIHQRIVIATMQP